MAETVATEQEKIAWYNVIGQFRQKVAEFEAMLEKLKSQKQIAASDPELAQEYSGLMNKAVALQDKIRQIRDATSDAIDWIKGVFGFDGLGIVPLIPIAVVSASIATIGYWIKDAYEFSKKLEKVEQLEKQGMPTRQAIDTANRMTTGPSIFGINPKWLVYGGIALVMVPIVAPAIKSFLSDR